MTEMPLAQRLISSRREAYFGGQGALLRLTLTLLLTLTAANWTTTRTVGLGGDCA